MSHVARVETMTETPLQSFGKRTLKVLLALLPLFIFAIAIHFLRSFLGQHSLAEIIDQIRELPTLHLVEAAGLTFFYYLLLSTYDLIAFMYLRNPLNRWKVIATSLIGYALSNSTGFGGVAGNAFRFRNYMHYGVSAIDVLKVLSMIILSFWLGTLSITGFSFVFFPLDVSSIAPVPQFLFQILGGIFLTILGLYVALCYLRKEPIVIRGRAFRLPSSRLTLMQVSLATADWILGASVLYVLLPTSANIEFPMFVAIFSTSTILGLIANVPGGLGVLEALILFFVGSSGASPTQIMGSLLIYRCFFNFCPFVLALSAIGIIESRRHWRAFRLRGV